MCRAQVVVGAGYGDEGKGTLTDALAARAAEAGTVVRFNGGAQAGHTVELPDGRRHVFAHVGSGTFAGWTTVLSRFFVCHPPLFLREWQALARLGTTPDVTVDPRCPVTTPFDMLVNQWAEQARGAARHGSVGVGFGETVGRCEDPAHALRVADLPCPDNLRQRLTAIRDVWLPARLATLGVPPPVEEQATLLRSPALIDRFVEDCAAFLARVAVRVPDLHGPIVFEGAQGLLLDQDRGAFPYVTRSNTGLRNVLALAGEAGIKALDVHYVTRCYATRHGAGPLAHAWAAPRPVVVDRTNLPHPYQGTPRQGWLDLDVLGAAIAVDLSDARGTGLAVRHGLAVTCLDQADAARWSWVSEGQRRHGSAKACAAEAARHARGPLLWQGHGPTRQGLVRLRGRRAAGRLAAIDPGATRLPEPAGQFHRPVDLDQAALERRGSFLGRPGEAVSLAVSERHLG